jgi:hypothetical protein
MPLRKVPSEVRAQFLPDTKMLVLLGEKVLILVATPGTALGDPEDIDFVGGACLH